MTEPDFQEGAFCPIISKDWLEARYGTVIAASILEEIRRADMKAQVANDILPAYKIA